MFIGGPYIQPRHLLTSPSAYGLVHGFHARLHQNPHFSQVEPPYLGRIGSLFVPPCHTVGEVHAITALSADVIDPEPAIKIAGLMGTAARPALLRTDGDRVAVIARAGRIVRTAFAVAHRLPCFNRGALDDHLPRFLAGAGGGNSAFNSLWRMRTLANALKNGISFFAVSVSTSKSVTFS